MPATDREKQPSRYSPPPRTEGERWTDMPVCQSAKCGGLEKPPFRSHALAPRFGSPEKRAPTAGQAGWRFVDCARQTEEPRIPAAQPCASPLLLKLAAEGHHLGVVPQNLQNPVHQSVPLHSQRRKGR